MANEQDLIGSATGADPAEGLRAVGALRELLERLERLQVDSARKRGWSWQQIATELGVSKQSVHKKHNGITQQGNGLLRKGN